MSKIDMPNMLLVAGQSQNVGKTLLASQVMNHFSRNADILYLKVSPHFHKSVGQTILIKKTDSFELHEDRQTNLNKDTCRMLKAGASKSFLLMADENGLADGLNIFVKQNINSLPVVCESGGLINLVKPGVFLYLRQLNCKVCKIDENNNFRLASRIVTYTVNSFDISMSEINLENGCWSIKT